MAFNIVSSKRYARHEIMTVYYLDNTEQYYVIFKTKIGTFNGVATYNKTNSFDDSIGECLAEYRAWLAYYKALRNKCRDELKALTDFYSSVKDMKAFDENNKIVNKMRYTINKKKEELADLKAHVKISYRYIENLLSYIE